MRLDALFTPLFEMDWYDKSPMTAVLQQNRGKWIHFSQGAPNRDYRTATTLPEPAKPDYYNRSTDRKYQRDVRAVQRKNAMANVPKMGVNPRSIWNDPRGIYFYPVNWLLSGAERISQGQQHGVNYPYYYIADIALNDPNGVNLGTMTWQDVEAIARRNGWLEAMQEFRGASAEQQKTNLFSYSRPDLPGSFFWHFIDRSVKDGKLSWLTAYKGISYIRDPGLSIIHSNEPDQILVLDPRIIKNTQFGENKRPINFSDANKVEHWMHALMTIIRRVRGEYGGDLTWEKKRPILKFSKGAGKFILTIPTRSGDEMQPALTLNYTYGRAEDSLYFKYETLLNEPLERIVQSIVATVEKTAAMKTDITFKPLISIDEGKQVMIHQIASDLEMSISTTINNSTTRRYNQARLYGETTREIDRVAIKTSCHLTLSPDKMDGSANVWLGKHHMIYTLSGFEDHTDPAAMSEAMAVKAHDNLTKMMTSFAPTTSFSSYDNHSRFHYPEQVPAFLGWVALNCGLSLNGEMKKHFAKEIAAFEAYPERRVLLADIAHVMNSKW